MEQNKANREEDKQTVEESSVPETKKDELITDKSIEDPTTSSYGERKFNPHGLNLTWFALAIAVGILYGVVTDQLWLGVSAGVFIGLLLSIVRRK